MLTAYIIGVVLFIAYITAIIIINDGTPSSLSDSFYLLGESPRGYLFTLAMWAVVFCIAPYWLSHTDDKWMFSAFFACGGLMLVGAAPMFKTKDAVWHTVFAIICAVFALLNQVLMGQYWELPSVAAITMGIAIGTKTLKYSYTFYLEIVAFFSTFVSVLCY